jgi:hypothetical protein
MKRALLWMSLTAISMLILVYVVMRFTGLPVLLLDFIRKISKHEVKLYHFELLNVAVVSLLGIVFGLLGHRLAKKRHRNVLGWTVLCVLFNLWPFLVLYYLPKKANGSVCEKKE